MTSISEKSDDNINSGIDSKRQTKLNLDSPTEDEISKELAKDPQKAKMMLAILERSFSGPLPPPEIIKQYDTIVPGSAKMIFEDFHKQSEHRRDLEKDTIISNNKQSGRGQVFALIIGISGISRCCDTGII